MAHFDIDVEAIGKRYLKLVLPKPGAITVASSAVGQNEQINQVDEVRIETFFPRERAKAVVTALRAAHPYEDPVIYLLPLIEEADL